MSLLGGLSGDPDEKYIDDQSMQEDHRNNLYVGHAIDMACTVYDTLFNALKYAIRGRANVIEQMDKAVDLLEKQCNDIVEKYKEILSKLKDVGAGLSANISLDIAKDAFDLLNSNPILRRYVGEANYWALWDMLAVLSGQGSTVGADVSSNIKDAIKGTIYALLSMTNGMMHFESYISQITSFWGALYLKEINLPLTDSVCPQVTCQYYYKTPENGNPVPGIYSYAPMPFPIFNQVDYSWPYILSHFSYDDPGTWDVLTPQSRGQMQKAYNYWKSNYTNAISANDLLSGASSKLTGGAFTVGFGPRNDNYGGISNNAPLKMGATFNQLDKDYSESFSVNLADDDIMEGFKNVDNRLQALVERMADPEIIEKRDAAVLAATVSEAYPDGNSDYIGDWFAVPLWNETDSDAIAAGAACAAIVTSLPEFTSYLNAIKQLSTTYHSKDTSGAPYLTPASTDFSNSPLVRYLVDLYSGLAEDSLILSLRELMVTYASNYNMAAPYAIYSDDPNADIAYTCVVLWQATGKAPLYSAGASAMGYEIDVDEELGKPVDRGREPLFAALGIYGDLKGLYPWDYTVVPLESFRENYTRIRSAFHIYYKNSDPASVVFADNVIQAGTLKYITTCRPVVSDTISRGSETYTAYIFPSETCSVYLVPDPGKMYGMDFPSLASLQPVDAVNERTGEQYMYGITTNMIPRYPKFVDAEKWSIMDLIHELWLLADGLAPICGDGGERRDKLNDLLNEFGLNARGSSGPQFIGQLPNDGQASHVTMEFTLMNDFAVRIRDMIDTVYRTRDDLIAATRAW